MKKRPGLAHLKKNNYPEIRIIISLKSEIVTDQNTKLLPKKKKICQDMRVVIFSDLNNVKSHVNRFRVRSLAV